MGVTHGFSKLVLLIFILSWGQLLQAQTLANSSFEIPSLTPGVADFSLVDASTVDGWDTTASDNLIEVWSDGFNGVPSFDQAQHVELNANEVSTLFQTLSGVGAGSPLSFQFAHRGRLGVDTIRLAITDLGADGILGGGDDTLLFTRDYATDSNAWALYDSSTEAAIIAPGNPLQFSFESVSSAGGNAAVGNFLDAVEFGVGIVQPPLPPPASVPTLSVYSAILLALGLLCFALLQINRSRRQTL